MRLPMETYPRASRSCRTSAMRDELCHALVEALFELEVLPHDDDAALLGLYAVMDDLEAALRRAQAMDLARSA